MQYLIQIISTKVETNKENKKEEKCTLSASELPYLIKEIVIISTH